MQRKLHRSVTLIRSTRTAPIDCGPLSKRAGDWSITGSRIARHSIHFWSGRRFPEIFGNRKYYHARDVQPVGRRGGGRVGRLAHAPYYVTNEPAISTSPLNCASCSFRAVMVTIGRRWDVLLVRKCPPLNLNFTRECNPN